MPMTQEQLNSKISLCSMSKNKESTSSSSSCSREPNNNELDINSLQVVFELSGSYFILI